MHVVYLGILAACLVGTAPLEVVLRVRVYARWRRLVATLVPVVAVFGAWDVLEIRAGAWHYDGRYLVGVTLPGRLPLEELLFFLVIPACAILTLEAVRARRPDWLMGDEPPTAWPRGGAARRRKRRIGAKPGGGGRRS